MSRPPRNIDDVINALMVTTKNHGKNTTIVIWRFRDLQSSIRYMPSDRLVMNEHWRLLVTLLGKLFPMTEENKNDPLIVDLLSIISGANNEVFEKYEETAEEVEALRELSDVKNALSGVYS